MAILDSRIPIGTIKTFGGGAIPAGFLGCDGSSLARAVYPLLFNAIGTTYGAPDSNTFNLPDLRGRAAIGSGAGPGLSSRALGQQLGEESHALNSGELPSHQHGAGGMGTTYTNVDHQHVAPLINANNAPGGGPYGGPTYSSGGLTGGAYNAGGYEPNTSYAIDGNLNHVHGVIGLTDGGNVGGGSHNNMQPSLAVNFIIRY